MNYEFHITVGQSRLVRNLNAQMNSFEAGTPVLAIENLDQEGFPVATHWMTAEKAFLQGGHLAALRHLSNYQNQKGWRTHSLYQPIRLKIEAEYLPEIAPEEYLYIETHFNVTPEEARQRGIGISRNLFTGKLIATERCYDSSKFHEFAQAQSALNRKVEICLYDSNVRLDVEGKWMKVPKKIGKMSEVSAKAVSNAHVSIFDRGIVPKNGWEVH